MEVGCNTPEVEAVWMGYTDGSCYGDKHVHGALPAQASRWEIKKRRGDPLDEAGMGAIVSPKEERREGEGGVRYRRRGMGLRADWMLGKGKVHSAQRR